MRAHHFLWPVRRYSAHRIYKMTASNALPPNKHFYRRVLPESCISFSSDEGKQLFKEALVSGHMECYFKLAAQFRTQDEPAFCGLSTMVMVLNALNIDPGKIWKGPWRWYHENMLDCCVPLQVVQQQGINFDQFLCVASCNSLNVTATRMVMGTMAVDKFRDIVSDYTQRDDKFIVLSYSRKVLDQTGDGHFSPIGGYHPTRDMVLMLDTARFKYPPHWVPVQLIYDAMTAIDQETGKPRGMVLMSRRKKSRQLLLFRLASNMSLTATGVFSPGIPEFMLRLKQLLGHKPEEQLPLDELASKAARDMTDLLSEIQDSVIIMTTQLDISCPEDVAKEHECAVGRLIKRLEETLIFEKVAEILKCISPERKSKLERLFGTAGKCCSEKCNVYNKIDCTHFLAFFILSWPYKMDTSGEVTLGAMYGKMVDDVLQKESLEDLLTGEVNALQDQLSVLIDVFVKNPECVGAGCKKRKVKSESCHSQ